MYKLVLVSLLAVSFLGLYAIQLDEAAAVQVFFQLKYSVNRAAHAAAQQVDLYRLAEGEVRFDEAKGQQEAERYLQSNMYLDEQLMAEDHSFLQGNVRIEVLEFIDDSYTFPHRYVNEDYEYAVTLHKPGVIMIIRAEYRPMFSVIKPIVWYVKGAAEIVR